MDTTNLVKELITDKEINHNYYNLIGGNIDDAIKLLNYVKLTFSPRYEKIMIEITNDDYDQDVTFIKFHGYRKPNDEDLAKRQRSKEEIEKWDLKQLENLAAKYNKKVI